MSSWKRTIPFVMVVAVLLLTLTACGFFGADTGSTKQQTGGSVYVRIHELDGYTVNDFVDKATFKTKIPGKIPEKDGYDFDGWYTDEARTKQLVAGVKLTDGMTLDVFPKWVEATVQVKIVDEFNGTSVVRVGYGKTLEIDAPTAEGYDFLGYYSDEARTEAFDAARKTITEDIQIYVKWSPKSFTVRFWIDGDKVDEQVYRKGASTVFPTTSTETYAFIGWYKDVLLIDECEASEDVFDDAEEVVDVYGKVSWKIATATLKEGTSMRVCAGEEADFEYQTDYRLQTVNLPSFFTFSIRSTVVVRDEGDAVVAGGSVVLAQNSGDAAIVTFYEMTVESEDESTQKTYVVKITQNDASMLTVTYKVDGETVRTKIVTSGSLLPDDYEYVPDAAGYAFSYWTKNGTSAYDFSTSVTESFTLTAVLTEIEYAITYSVGYGGNNALNPVRYTVTTNVTLLDPTAPDGYTFVGWYKDAGYKTAVTGWNGVTGNRTVYAQYTKAAKWAFVPEDGEYTVTMAQYPYLLDYLLYTRDVNEENKVIAVINVTDKPDDFMTRYTDTTFTVLAAEGATEYATKVLSPAGDVSLSYGAGCSLNGSKVTVTFEIRSEFYPTETSSVGTYDQVAFAPMSQATGRSETFNDFAVDHVKATLDATDTEQLFFALENGYRPVCATGSRAELVYGAMKSILRGIVDDTMTDREKCVAIGEYLVREIAYDNAVYNAYLRGDDTSASRCFALEGAILDKVAVCDGISKAFACLARIEGIEAIQVDGTHNGVNHAWNKVYLDLDGNGEKEWTAVDCTSANLELTISKGAKHVEIMNHTFFFVTDAFLASENYAYNAKWSGSQAANSGYNLYMFTEYTEGKTYYVNTSSDLNVFCAWYRALYLASDETISVGFCARRDLVVEVADGENRIKAAVGNALRDAGFSVAQVNNDRVMTIANVENEDDVVLLFYIEK